MIHTDDPDFTLHQGNVLEVLPTLEPSSVNAVVTSPPYLDARPEYAAPLDADYGEIFEELLRIVDGVMLWNVGRLWRQGIEQTWWLRLIEAATANGWQHWDTLIWVKLNSNPIQGRVAANGHEYVLVFGQPGAAVNEEGRRKPYADGSVERLRRRWMSSLSVKGDTPDRSGPKRDARVGKRRQPNDAGARAPSWIVTSTGKEKGNPHPAPMAFDLALELVTLASWPGQIVLGAGLRGGR